MNMLPAASRPWISLIVGLVSAISLSTMIGCSPAAVPIAAKQQAIKVNVVAVQERDLLDFQEFVGRTEPSETVEVRSRLTGFIREVKFSDGDIVSSRWVVPTDNVTEEGAGKPESMLGQPLFLIEPEEFEAIHQQSLARIEVWKAKRELAQTKLVRLEKLISSNAVSQEELEENRAALKEASANVVVAEADAARTALDVAYTVVRAEIDGQVDRALVTRGNLVSGGIGAGTLLTRIVKNDPMYVYFDVDEKSFLQYLRRRAATDLGSAQDPDVQETAKGLLDQSPKDRTTWLEKQRIPCYLKLADEQDFSHAGLIDFYENRIDASTARLRVRGTFRNVNNLLAGGMFVRIRVYGNTEKKPTLLIPEKCIGYDQDLRFVYVVDGSGVPERRTVEIGDRRGEWRKIESGVQVGDRVVYEGMQRIRRVVGGSEYEAVEAIDVDSMAIPEESELPVLEVPSVSIGTGVAE